MSAMALRTRSGVAGVSNAGSTVYPDKLDMASFSAHHTEMASMKGGSPTAFE